MKNEIINEIINRLEKAFAVEVKARKEWVAAGFPEDTAPTALGLIGDAKTGYECLRASWWKNLGCAELADGLDYSDTAHEVEKKAKIINLSFGS